MVIMCLVQVIDHHCHGNQIPGKLNFNTGRNFFETNIPSKFQKNPTTGSHYISKKIHTEGLGHSHGNCLKSHWAWGASNAITPQYTPIIMGYSPSL